MATKTTKKTKKSSGSKLPLIDYKKIGGDLTYDQVGDHSIDTPAFDFTDTNFNVDKITAGSVQADALADRFMTTAEYATVDPSKIAEQYGDINRSEIAKNAELSSQLALDNLNTELSGLQNFVPAASALKRSQTALDNDFNQAERARQLEAGDPNIKKDLESQAERSRAYASGRAPSSIEDRALEMGYRSSSADSASSGGFGVASGAARKASELMSASQRIELSKYGDQLLSNNIQARNSTLLAPTQYSDAGSQIKVTPEVSAGKTALSIASEANAGNITADKALTNLTQQEQYQTSNEQETRKFNTGLEADKDLNQAKLNLDASSTNVENTLRADTQNASNSLTAQTTAASIKSNENQFKSNLTFNVDNSNADRAYQRDNVNAGRALDVAENNRSTRLQIETTNKNMIFQDQQNRKAAADASARASASAAASRANAALSYASNQSKIQAGLQMAAIEAETNRQQGQLAADAYKKGQSTAATSEYVKTGLGAVMQAPKIIEGISDSYNAISGLFKSSKQGNFGPVASGDEYGSFL